MRYMVGSGAGGSADSNPPPPDRPPLPRSAHADLAHLLHVGDAGEHLRCRPAQRMPSASACRGSGRRGRATDLALDRVGAEHRSCRPTRPQPWLPVLARPAVIFRRPYRRNRASAPARARGRLPVGSGEVRGQACPRNIAEQAGELVPRRRGRVPGTSGTGQLASAGRAPSDASAKLNGSMPMSTGARPIRGALLVCRVENTRWPVRGLDADRDGRGRASADHDHVGVARRKAASWWGESRCRPCG